MNSNLPTKIGEVYYTSHGITIHDAEARRFNPVEHYANPAAESLPKEAAPRAQPPHDFERPHPPIFLGTLAFAPIAYVVHKRTTECEHCGSVHYHSEVFAHNRLRNRSGTGYVENFAPVSAFAYNVPIHTIELKPARVPICIECAATVSLDHLPLPPPPERIVGLGGTAMSDAMEKAKAKAKALKPEKTIDDLI